jgi:hypothetical protein
VSLGNQQYYYELQIDTSLRPAKSWITFSFLQAGTNTLEREPYDSKEESSGGCHGMDLKKGESNHH